MCNMYDYITFEFVIGFDLSQAHDSPLQTRNTQSSNLSEAEGDIELNEDGNGGIDETQFCLYICITF